ncbi:MAG: efflux RND transporter periplasmic adaptor subunit [Planctomycetota bacterium]
MLSLIWLGTSAEADELESFTQPYRSIAVPASEMGVLAEIRVQVGSRVRKGQLLARLDDSVLQASRDITESSMRATSSRESAEAERVLTEQQLRSYRELHANGNATQREVDRAEANFWRATTRLKAVQEELGLRELEHQRILAQIQQRQIHSTIDGVVLSIDKEVGEFVSPTDPVVMRLVDLDRLKAVFSMPLSQINQWESNQRVPILVGRVRRKAMGVIETISPVAEAESSSVRITVRFENQDRQLRSGVVCFWEIDGEAPELTATRPLTKSSGLLR